jgi:hypothetical protein
MTLTFIEIENFMACRDDYFTSDDAFAALQQALMADPESGSVMRGCGGLRKIRWPDARRGRGKRGGLRVIYLLIPELEMVVFVDVYDKDEADDLTPDERRILAKLASESRDKLFALAAQQRRRR